MLLHIIIQKFHRTLNRSTPAEGKAGLSAYKAFQKQISAMSEAEKQAYVTGLKETMDGMALVQDVLMLQGMGNEMGDRLAVQAMKSAPGVFEACYERYQRGDYLTFTDSFWQEQSLIEELYEEWEKTAGYGAYLQSVQERGSVLGGIGIFGGTAGGGRGVFLRQEREEKRGGLRRALR